MLLKLQLALSLALLLAAPVGAEPPDRAGQRISLYSEVPITFPAGQPFHVAHGFTIDPAAGYTAGSFLFLLEIDRPLPMDCLEIAYASGQPEPLSRIWVYNVPTGMVGPKLLVGTWIAPCGYLSAYGDYDGPCQDPHDLAVLTKTRLVVFQ
jgi:hypothetical protein